MERDESGELEWNVVEWKVVRVESGKWRVVSGESGESGEKRRVVKVESGGVESGESREW